MATFLMTLHIFTCILLVLVVLVQSGKEGGLGMMGGGAGTSQSVFGSSGGADFFTKFTSGAAAVFMITSIFLSIVKGGKHSSVFASPSATVPAKTAPAAPTESSGAQASQAAAAPADTGAAATTAPATGASQPAAATAPAATPAASDKK